MCKIVLFITSSYSYKALINNVCDVCVCVETSGLSVREGCVQVFRMPTQFVVCVENGRPKSTLGNHWSLLKFNQYGAVYVQCYNFTRLLYGITEVSSRWCGGRTPDTE